MARLFTQLELAAFFDDGSREAQSQPYALTHILGGKERALDAEAEASPWALAFARQPAFVVRRCRHGSEARRRDLARLAAHVHQQTRHEWHRHQNRATAGRAHDDRDDDERCASRAVACVSSGGEARRANSY